MDTTRPASAAAGIYRTSYIGHLDGFIMAGRQGNRHAPLGPYPSCRSGWTERRGGGDYTSMYTMSNLL